MIQSRNKRLCYYLSVHKALGRQRLQCYKERAVPTINFVREGKKVQVEVGESLRYAALDNDIPLYTKMQGISNFIQCHGNGLCGTDEVIVSPANAVNPPTRQEKLNENIPPFGPIRQK